MRSTPKTKLSYHDILDWVWIVMKTRQDNDMTNHISQVYTKTETEMLGPV